jgi:aspartyl-tRNA(Asn)/glutamyl-tRNA(Gln) amidotransferase subunit A
MQTLDRAAAGLADGTLTSRGLIELALARIADPAGQGGKAFLRVYADQARASADAVDSLRRVNRAPSRYAGIPISVKDLFDVAGEPTPAGSVILADAPAARVTAPAIARLIAAGLIPVGRTNMTEFAFSGVTARRWGRGIGRPGVFRAAVPRAPRFRWRMAWRWPA